MRQLMMVLAALLLGGCGEYLANNGPDSPWAKCETADGGMAQSAKVGGAVGSILVGPAGGLVGVAMDPGHGQRVQDCRRKLMEQGK